MKLDEVRNYAESSSGLVQAMLDDILKDLEANDVVQKDLEAEINQVRKDFEDRKDVVQVKLDDVLKDLKDNDEA